MKMKRYRFSNFYIDTERNLWRLLEEHPKAIEIGREGLKSQFIEEYGSLYVEEKMKRYLEINPPSLCVILEYHHLIYETINAYVFGQYYPALTGACCIGETIFNSLLLKLRKYFISSPYYNKIHNKDSFQNWEEAIEILSSWGILTTELKKEYEQLEEIRKKSIHLRNVTNFLEQSRQAINTILLIIENLFGLKSEKFFWCPGELYIKKEKENEPIVKEYFLSACILLGYKHKVVDAENAKSPSFIYKDSNDYENKVISDEEFRELRIQWQSNNTGN